MERDRARVDGRNGLRSARANTRAALKAIQGGLLGGSALFRQLFHSSPIAILVRSARGPGVEANPAFHRLLGYSPEELESFHDQPLTHPDDLGRVMMLTQELIAGERDHFRLDKRYRHRDGSYVWVRTSCSAIRDQHGRTEHTISFIEDISEQKRHEEALRESEARFRQLVDNLEDGFWMANADLTELVYASPAIERLWGLSNNQISRDPSAVTAVVHPDDLERLGHYLPPNRITHRIDLQLRVMHADGTMRWLRIRAIPILGTDGAIHRIAGITEDITERMRAAESIDEIRKHGSRLVQALRQPLGVLHRALPAETDAPPPAQPQEEEPFALRVACLTPRQREVMELLVAGRSTKAIAAQLTVSPRTVEVHRSDVMRKLRVGSLAELVRLALTSGLRGLP